jgi:hypothetical protein
MQSHDSTDFTDQLSLGAVTQEYAFFDATFRWNVGYRPLDLMVFRERVSLRLTGAAKILDSYLATNGAQLLLLEPMSVSIKLRGKYTADLRPKCGDKYFCPQNLTVLLAGLPCNCR